MVKMRNTDNTKRMWNNKNSHSLYVEMQNGTAPLEDSLMVSYKTKYILAI